MESGTAFGVSTWVHRQQQKPLTPEPEQWHRPNVVDEDVQECKFGGEDGEVRINKRMVVKGNLVVGKNLDVLGTIEISGKVHLKSKRAYIAGLVLRPHLDLFVSLSRALPTTITKKLVSHESLTYPTHCFHEGLEAENGAGAVIIAGRLWVHGDLTVTGDLHVVDGELLLSSPSSIHAGTVIPGI